MPKAFAKYGKTLKVEGGKWGNSFTPKAEDFFKGRPYLKMPNLDVVDPRLHYGAMYSRKVSRSQLLHPCAICGKENVEIHFHSSMGTLVGAQILAIVGVPPNVGSDRVKFSTIPLCNLHHVRLHKKDLRPKEWTVLGNSYAKYGVYLQGKKL